MYAQLLIQLTFIYSLRNCNLLIFPLKVFIMSLSVPSTITITVLGQEVAVVEECVYLGSLVHSSTLSLFGHIARMPDETYARSNNNNNKKAVL